ncbi:MAG TPA: prephenate dehydratase [Thermoanaerobaculia bacterium]|nr:prephenate dehydratase [Thermoanaerobaculia bacterium]
MTIPMDELEALRARIDETDRRLLETLAARLAQVAEVGRLKARDKPFLRDLDREARLLARVEAIARELGLDPFRATEIFREIIAMSVKAQEEALLDRKVKERALDNAYRVAFQGAEGAYSHLAARKYFGDREGTMEFRGFQTFARALHEAESGAAGYAFLPIENTTAGSINETYDLLRHTELKIVGEEILEVRHCLLGLPGAPFFGLTRVVSQAQALAQCSHFLADLPGVTAVPFVDTAEAARHVRETGDPTLAAIASEEAGQRNGLEVLRRDVADQEENWTRFVVVSALSLTPDPRIPTKTSLVFSTPHRHGALAHCLNLLDAHGLNLTKLESRPVPRHPWEYLFYVDFEGAETEDAATRAVAALSAECPYLKVLGSYPARTTKKGRVDRLPESTP